MKRISSALLAVLPIVLAACGQSESRAPGVPAVSTRAAVSTPSEFPAVQPPSLAAAQQHAKGFDTGNLSSSRRVFVFFDPQCPHCGVLWNEAKQLEQHARFTWIPVALLNRKSLDQGAAILSASTPAAAMDSHEQKLLAREGGLDAPAADAHAKAAIERNTRLLASFGAQGVPYVLSTHVETGAVFAEARAMPAAELAGALGWTPNAPSVE